MATAAKLSPAANLLRQSRLFALPPVLSPPTITASSRQVTGSETATLPYPTRAAIETPHYSLNRGDWGLKRPLPSRSTTRTGTPLIRIEGGIDTFEHITDFASAADHVLNLRKWQELNMPVCLPEHTTTTNAERRKGVFESAADNTINITDPATQKRWRYAGPYLAGMTGMEFEAYLKGEVRKRKGEFKEKVRKLMTTEKVAEQKRLAIEEGSNHDVHSDLLEITETDLIDYMRSLRSKPGKFGQLIAEFLDLPEGPEATVLANNNPWLYGRETVASKVYSAEGPPQTHPSAGLSYLRTAFHVRNDPINGPQDLNPPTIGRVLKTRRHGSGKLEGNVGVAGFVVESVDSVGMRGATFSGYRPQPGGSKMVVRPELASIDTDGRVHLKVKAISKDNATITGLQTEEADPKNPLPTETKGSGDTMPYLPSAYARFQQPKSRFRQTREPHAREPESQQSKDIVGLMNRLDGLSQ